jgi:exodeoxyribonuclease V alpha subunit
MRKLKLPGRDATKPRLNEHDMMLIEKRGISGVKKDARHMVESKLKEEVEDDRPRVPPRGNPVYKAMHACNAESRKKLSLAHRIPAGKDLTDSQIDSIVNMLTRWIAREYNFYKEERKQQNLHDF